MIIVDKWEIPQLGPFPNNTNIHFLSNLNSVIILLITTNLYPFLENQPKHFLDVILKLLTNLPWWSNSSETLFNTELFYMFSFVEIVFKYIQRKKKKCHVKRMIEKCVYAYLIILYHIWLIMQLIRLLKFKQFYQHMMSICEQVNLYLESILETKFISLRRNFFQILKDW